MNFKAKGLLLAGVLSLGLGACGGSDSPHNNPTSSQGPAETSPDTAHGDWEVAQNLPESIYDARAVWLSATNLQITISYYDIDHLNDSSGFTKQVNFNVNASGEVDSDQSQFYATVDCVDTDCSSGSLFMGYLGSTLSKLNGTAKINFTMKSFRGVTKVITGSPAPTAPEYNLVDGLNNLYVAGGVAEGFEIEKGIANPFRITLHLGTRHIGPILDPRYPDYWMDFSTTKTDASAPVTATFTKFPDQTIIFNANKTFISGQVVEFDFLNAGTLTSVKSN